MSYRVVASGVVVPRVVVLGVVVLGVDVVAIPKPHGHCLLHCGSLL